MRGKLVLTLYARVKKSANREEFQVSRNRLSIA